MVLIEAWKRVMLEKFARFDGRAGRAEYWWFVLSNAVVVIVLAVLTRVSVVFTILLVAYYLALLIPSLAVAVRRLHDTDRSGWWLLISLIPLVGGIILIVFYATAGNPSSNQYGPPPVPLPA